LVLKAKEGGEHMVRELVMLIFSIYMIILIVIVDLTETAKTEAKQKKVIVPRGRAYWPKKTVKNKDTVISLFVIWIGTLFIAWDPTVTLWLLVIPAAVTAMLIWISGGQN
jgi:hypothetical protein